jgi:hypothetical protein
MSEEYTRPKATLLTPGEEYTEYKEFCATKGHDPVDEADFFRASYYLTARALVVGFDQGIASFCFGKSTLCLCELQKKTLVLALFETSEIEKCEKLAKEKNQSPIDHLG